MAGYIGSKAVITSGVSASIDELNIIDGVTATTAELNTLDGVTAVVGELNALDIGSTAVGTAVASKAVILDSNKDYTGLRNITLTGELDAGSLDVSGNADIDGTLETDALSIAGVVVTTTAAELNIIDGDTVRGTTAIVDADGVLVNDAGTMRMTSMATLATYMGTKITGGSMVYLASSGAISDGTASVVFTQFDASKYDHYEFMFQYVIPVTDGAQLLGVVSTDGGSNYDTTSGNYHRNGAVDAAGYTMPNNTGSDTNEHGLAGAFNLYGPHRTNYTYAKFDLLTVTSSADIKGPDYNQASGEAQQHLVAADVDAIKILFTSGNIEAGEIVMYGIANGS